MKKIIFNFFSIFCCLIVSQIDSYAQFEDWKYEVIKSETSDLNIIASSVDSKGMIWLSTRLGITTFDGEKYKLHPIFQQPSLQSKTLNCRYIKFDPQGRIWMLTDDRGIFVYDFNSGKSWSLRSKSTASIMLENERCGDVIFEGDDAWLVTYDHKLYKVQLNNNTVESYDAWYIIKTFFPKANFGMVGSIIKQDHIFWIGSRYGLLKFDQSKIQFELIKFDNDFTYETSQDYQFAMYLNDDDLLVSMTFEKDHNTCIYDTKNSKWRHCIDFNIPNAHFLSLHLRSFTKWSDSLLIAGSRRFVIHLINPANYNTKSIYEQDINLNYRDFQELATIHKVNDNLAYIVSTNNIVRMRKFKNPFRVLEIDPSGAERSNWQRSLLLSKDGAYLGTYFGDGLIYLNWQDKTINHFPKANKISEKIFDVESIARRSDSTLWLATSAGIMIFNPFLEQIKIDTSIGLFPPYIPQSDIQELFLFSSNLFISSKSNGLMVYNIESKQSTTVSFSNLKENYETTIVKDIHVLSPTTFLATTTRGLIEIKRGEDGKYVAEIPSELTTHKLAEIDLKYMVSVQDTLYITSNGDGLFRVVIQDQLITNIDNYLNPENLRYNVLGKPILSKDEKYIWVNTGDGFTKYNRSNHHFSNYSIQEGLSFRRGAGKNFFRLNDTTLIAGAHKSLIYFNPNEIKDEHIPIKPCIRSIFKDQALQAISPNINANISFGKEANNITIEMGAINYNPHPITYYSYKLDGYDNNWSKPSKSSTAQYTKLPGGNFNFKYKVANSNFNWVTGTTIVVIKKKKLSEHSWFIPLMLLLLLMFLYFLYLKRVNFVQERTNREQKYLNLQKEKIESELTALRAQMNPHFLFNTLNSINWYIIKNKPIEASKYLTKFSKLMRLILENSKEEMITLTKELETLNLYIEMESARFEGQFNFNKYVAEALDPSIIKLPPLVIQPFIENAIWHGLVHKEKAGFIQLDISIKNNQLYITIEDDGIGRVAAQNIKNKATQHRASSGIEITTDRIRGLKGALPNPIQINDLYNQDGLPLGTKIAITIPLIYHTQKFSKS